MADSTESVVNPAGAELASPPDAATLRSQLEALCEFDRESASEGELQAAQWLVERLDEAGVQSARIEPEPGANGTYWRTLGATSAVGALAGLAALRGGAGKRLAAIAAGAAASFLAAEECPPRSRALRKQLPNRTAHQVTAEIGPPDAERTIVLMAHHDTAHSGLLFSPDVPERLAEAFPWFFTHNDTSPPLMYPVVFGPALVAAGAATGMRKLTALGTALSAGSAITMADIGSRGAVPGANDNGTAVVSMVALAKALVDRPPQNTKIVFLSTSEEALCEGMGEWWIRRGAQMQRESTFFLCLDTVGSPHLCVLRGEGMLKLTDYPAESLALVDGLAEELGIELMPNLRLRNATDAVFPLKHGYQCISMASVTELKQPANYHWPTDTPENVTYETVQDAIRLSEAVIRRLDERWLG